MISFSLSLKSLRNEDNPINPTPSLFISLCNFSSCTKVLKYELHRTLLKIELLKSFLFTILKIKQNYIFFSSLSFLSLYWKSQRYEWPKKNPTQRPIATLQHYEWPKTNFEIHNHTTVCTIDNCNAKCNWKYFPTFLPHILFLPSMPRISAFCSSSWSGQSYFNPVLI